jgi:hypothetical protein
MNVAVSAEALAQIRDGFEALLVALDERLALDTAGLPLGLNVVAEIPAPAK